MESDHLSLMQNCQHWLAATAHLLTFKRVFERDLVLSSIYIYKRDHVPMNTSTRTMIMYATSDQMVEHVHVHTIQP